MAVLQTKTMPPLVHQATRSASLQAQVVILHDISWETYFRLLLDNQENSSTRFTYDQGTLQIMVLSPRHEALKHALSLLVDEIAIELGIDAYGFGSTTFQRHDLARGFEPDACFYIQHGETIRGRNEIDLTVDPPPDLIIEIDITNPSINKFPIFAALGIPELWRYDGERIGIFALQGNNYIEQPTSIALPGVTGAALTDLLDASQQMRRSAWVMQIRQWIRSQQQG